MRRRDWLLPGEEVITTVRPHSKALFWPVIFLLVMAGILGVGTGVLMRSYELWSVLVLWGAGLLLIGLLVIRPITRWASRTLTLTTRRVIMRSGVFRRTDHAVLLSHVNDVACGRSLLDRLFGCGTLVLDTAASEPLAFNDVPKVRAWQRAVSSLIDDPANAYLGAGELGPAVETPYETAERTMILSMPEPTLRERN